MLDRIERQVLADRQVTAVLIAAGADIPLPNFYEQRAIFDASLVEEPKPQEPLSEADAEQLELREALGVA